MKKAQTYAVDVERPTGEWCPLFGLTGIAQGYGLGYLEARRSAPGPHPAYRLRREQDGRVSAVVPAATELSYGLLPQGFGHQWRYILAAVETGLRRAAADARSDPDVNALPVELEVIADRVQELRR